MAQSDIPTSPCIGVCRLATNDILGQEVCIGCLRTINEIVDWPSYDFAQKRNLLAALEQRKKKSSDATE